MKRHPWKTKKYIRFEEALTAAGITDNLGRWMHDQITADPPRGFKPIARDLSINHPPADEAVSNQTVCNWYADWLEHEWYAKELS